MCAFLSGYYEQHVVLIQLGRDLRSCQARITSVNATGKASPDGVNFQHKDTLLLHIGRNFPMCCDTRLVQIRNQAVPGQPNLFLHCLNEEPKLTTNLIFIVNIYFRW
jgi:hypothetical protein